jgi:hypothetical protein
MKIQWTQRGMRRFPGGMGNNPGSTADALMVPFYHE